MPKARCEKPREKPREKQRAAVDNSRDTSANHGVEVNLQQLVNYLSFSLKKSRSTSEAIDLQHVQVTCLDRHSATAPRRPNPAEWHHVRHHDTSRAAKPDPITGK